jgi:HK97 family phage prohead protease
MTDLASRADRQGVVEKRSRPFEGIELRDVADGTGGNTLRFTGYASVVESAYEMQDYLGDYTEVIRSGAFAATLAAGADVPFKLNHDGMTLARTKSGTMRLAEDSTGLHVEADLDAANPQVQALRSAMQRRDLDEMSFAFRVNAQQWSPDWSQRDITEVDLNKGDVSVVNYGANPHTAGLTSLRSAEFASAMRELRAGDLTPDRLDAVLRLIPELAAALPTAEADEAREVEYDLSQYDARLRALHL